MQLPSSLRLRIPYSVALSSPKASSSAAPSAAVDDDWPMYSLFLFNNFMLEFVGTMVLVYSCMYVPTSDADSLAQLVPAVAIAAVMLNLKDHSYFCPDASPITTLVLLSAGAYTRKNDGTVWGQLTSTWSQIPDVAVRFLGQIIAYVVAYLTIFGPNIHVFSKVPPPELLVEELSLFNEGLATAVECMAMAFVLTPLLMPPANDKNGYTTYAAKVDIDPPSNSRLAFAAASLALIHWMLERLFRTTMNPFIYYMHCQVLGQEHCSDAHFLAVAGYQIAGVVAACVYAYAFIPKPGKLRSL